jgi:hypothetical protein
MLRNFLLLLFFIFYLSFIAPAQTDTSHLRISLLTCTPGKDLYSTFGHSALRITDSLNHDDIVYNYGTFDFSEPGFYFKFTRGKLLYYLSTEDFDSFRDFYREENRGITEQVLNLTSSEKNKIKEFLRQNLESGNRFYKYDFLFDNCTTKLRDLIEQTSDSTVVYGTVLKKKATFRQLIYEYLNYGDKQWSKLGIDLLLGSKTDAVTTKRQVMFLPDYLLKTFDSSKIDGRALVASSGNLYDFTAESTHIKFLTHPAFVFSILLLIIAALSASKNTSVQRFIYSFDGFIFFITGLLGLIIIFMWFGTDHIMCTNNYNLLWAWPTHIAFAFYINSRKHNAAIYFKITAIVNSVLLLAWFFIPQHLNTALIPVILLLIYRSAMAGYRLKRI